MSVAVTSLPVPLSPVMSTVLSLFPITRRNSNTARMRALLPTTTESSDRFPGIMASSHQPQGFEFGQFFPQRGLDTEIQRHVRAGAAGAHAGQPHACGIAFDFHHLDVAAVCLQKRPDATQNGFDALFGDHDGVLKGNACATERLPKIR